MPSPNELGDSWFSKPPKTPEPSLPPPSMSPPPLPERSLRWALALGFAGGAAGGVAMVLVAGALARRWSVDLDLTATLARAAHVPADAPRGVTLALAAGLGALVGLALGVVLRHTGRLVARLLAAVLLAPALWTCAHAFVLSPRARALPFGPLVVGAAIYGLCVAVLPPPRRRVPEP